MPWLGAYIASDKCPVPEKLDSLCLYIAEDLELLDTPVHIHVHVVTMHEYKTTMTVSV